MPILKSIFSTFPIFSKILIKSIKKSEGNIIVQKGTANSLEEFIKKTLL